MSVTIIIALILFALTYVGLFAFPKYRAYVALGSAVIFSIWLGLINKEVEWTLVDVFTNIDYNVLMMIAGTMGIVSLFIESKMPMKLADVILSKFNNVQLVIVAMAVMSGIVSAFIDNVATVLMIAPIALAVCKKQKISPVAPIVAIAVSSNLQGAATLVGDTTSILLAKEAGMNFLDFFFFNGKWSIFWAVEIGAALTAVLLLWMFRKEKKPLTLEKDDSDDTKVTDYVPTVLMVGVIVCLIAASFIPSPAADSALKTVFDLKNGIICMSLLVIGLVIEVIKNKNISSLKLVGKEMDYETLLLLASLFVVIGCISEAGVINKIAEFFTTIGGNSVFLMYTLIVFVSVLVSAFVDNIPYVTVMLPVITKLSMDMGCDPLVLYFGLLIGATLGGNITPVGASANITGIGILRKEGYEVKNKDFMSISVPFTAIAVLSGYLLVWLFCL